MKTLLPIVLLITIGLYALQSNKSDDSSNTEKYEREFKDQVLFKKTEKEFHNKSTEFNLYIPSKKKIVFVKRNSFDGSNFKLNYMDPESLQITDSVNLQLPTHASILHSDEQTVFYRKGFNVHRLNLESKKLTQLNDSALKISAISPLSEFESIIMGSSFQDKGYTFGYYKMNLETKKITDTIHVLHKSDSDRFIENSLKYAGRFHYSNGQYIYVFDKYGKLMLFDKNGNLSKSISTLDKVKLPNITYFNGMYTYKRGSTFNANSAAFISKKNIYSFSCRPGNVDHMILDKYDISTGKYLESYKLSIQNHKSSNINYLTEVDNDIILGFNNSLYRLERNE